MEIVEISSAFRAVLPEPVYIDGRISEDWLSDREVLERQILKVICDELTRTGLPAVLIVGGERKDLPASDLRHAYPCYLAACNHLFTDTWELRAYKPYPEGKVYIPKEVKEAAVKSSLISVGKAKPPGRPSIQESCLVKYNQRFPEGHRKEGISWSQACLESGLHANQKDTLKRALGEK